MLNYVTIVVNIIKYYYTSRNVIIMKNIDLKEAIQKVKQFVKHFMFYVVFVLSLTVGFSVGYYYNTLKEYKKNIYAPEVVLKKNVTLAIDEQNNMIIINKTDGSYILYEDSIGLTIFNFYAKNIWGQHNNSSKK